MIYAEMDFMGIADIPRISTMFYIDNTKWAHWKVNLTDEYLEVHSDTRNILIKLEDILFVDRPLSQAIINKIQNSSRHAAVIVIDYKKAAFIGEGDVLNSMVLAGKKTDISNIKYMLLSLLGLKVDPLVGSMKPEEIRLLCLLASGVNNMDLLVPIFDGNDELLHKTFSSLKAKKLVDDYAAITSLGSKLVNKVRGAEKKKIGCDVHDKFDDLKKVWDCMDSTFESCQTNRMIWKSGNSTLCGNIEMVDIKDFLPVRKIIQIEVDICKNYCSMDLILYTGNNSHILLRSHDYSIIIAFYGILNKEEDMQIRVLFCLYLGYDIESDILEILQISLENFTGHYLYLVNNGLYNEEDSILTSKGLNLVYKKVLGDISVLFKCTTFKYNSDNFKRIEKIKKECAKKKVIDLLKSRKKGEKDSNNMVIPNFL